MVFPDRTKYVNMKCDFMQAYMRLLVDTCHKVRPFFSYFPHTSHHTYHTIPHHNPPRHTPPHTQRGAPATTGMAALVSDPLWDPATRQAKIAGVEDAKRFEAEGGADGALIYDTTLLPVVRRVFDGVLGGKVNQLDRPVDAARIGSAELLRVPPGGITLDGVRFNVAIGLRFIESWLRGVRGLVWRGASRLDHTEERTGFTHAHTHDHTYPYKRNDSHSHTHTNINIPIHTTKNMLPNQSSPSIPCMHKNT